MLRSADGEQTVDQAFVRIVTRIVDKGVDFFERGRQAGEVERQPDGGPQLDRQILAQSPLAAAIYILNVPLSHVALSFVNMGAPAWREA